MRVCVAGAVHVRSVARVLTLRSVVLVVLLGSGAAVGLASAAQAACTTPGTPAADEKYFVGGVGQSDWATAGFWNPAGAPVASSIVCIVGSSDHTVDLNGASATVAQLHIKGSPASNKTLRIGAAASASLTVSGAMSYDRSGGGGTLRIETGSLILNGAATWGGTASSPVETLNDGTPLGDGANISFITVGGTLTLKPGAGMNGGNGGLLSIVAGGALVQDAGGVVDLQGTDVANAGTVSLPAGRSLRAMTYSQSAGGATSLDSTLTTIRPEATTLNGGVLSGLGTVGHEGGGLALTNAGGTIRPGSSSVGTLTVDGNVVQGTGGTLELDVAGASGGQHDVLAVTGDVVLGGTAKAVLGGGFVPVPSDVFPVVTSAGPAGVTGTFTSVDGPIVGGRTWSGGVAPAGTPKTTAFIGLGSQIPVAANTGVPMVSGNPAVGATLTCTTGAWTGSPTDFAITWLRNGQATGVSGSTYLVTAADQGTTVTCIVVATNLGGNSTPAVSAGQTVPAAPTPGPAASPPVPTTPVPSTPAAVSITRIATLPPAKACVSRRKFPIRLRNVKVNKIVRAQIKLNGTQVRNITGKALSLPIDLRGLPKGRFTVEILTTDSAGKKIVGKRVYRTCALRRR